jgi:hypothetical protein
MLNQRVVVMNPAEEYYGKVGTVVVVSINIPHSNKAAGCKLLIGDLVSNWIPYKSLKIVNDYFISA